MRCANCGRDLESEDTACECAGLTVEAVLTEPAIGGLSPVGPTSPFEGQTAKRGLSGRLPLLILAVAVLVGGLGYGAYALIHHVTAPKPSVFVTLQAQGSEQVRVSQDTLQQCVDIIQRRLSASGVSGSRVTVEGLDRIVLGLTKDTDVDEAVALALQSGGLAFYAVSDFGDSYDSAAEALAAAGVTSESDLPDGTSLIEWPADEFTNPTDTYYLVTEPPAVTGDMVKNADWDSRGVGGAGYRVTLDFTAEGAAAFADATQELAAIGAATGVSQELAIVLGGVVKSAPTVHDEITGGSAEITGNFTMEEVRTLAAVMNAGVLPLELVRVR
jgi:preprotein translocase subunit SecD